ncbi:GTP-binding protein Rhb1 [Rhizoctonia solani]|uniref:GTP-binding protein Rhb1 n=1 Tax=Rhizoctonia solani TaxID=456999 RepID=A0A8H8NNU8_9AGAM|nr:GTP-binding protein Rhb1 [Rhizoctonia solani]QRW17149.1 GTP-binding protein Rhb1 [Rhizoctonia solani]
MPLCGSSSASVGGFAKKPIQRKIVVCGDGGCGKTSLLNVFTRGFFTQVYEPTFENYVQDVKSMTNWLNSHCGTRLVKKTLTLRSLSGGARALPRVKIVLVGMIRWSEIVSRGLDHVQLSMKRDLQLLDEYERVDTSNVHPI